MTTFRSSVPMLLLAGLAGLAGCSGNLSSPDSNGGSSSQSLELIDVTFAKALDDDKSPVDPTTEFQEADTVCVSVAIKGRPKNGALTCQFFFRDNMVAEATVDFSAVNSGLIFSVGENSNAGYSMTHDEPLPISGKYRADLVLDGEKLNSYSFRVIPPPESIESSIMSTTLARGADDDYNAVDETSQFAPVDAVHLVGRGDLGIRSWIEANWYVNGVLDENGTRSLTLNENAADTGFSFNFLPDEGWPSGEHEVVLIMNDDEVARHEFTVAE